MEPRGVAPKWIAVGLAVAAVFLLSADPDSHAHSLRIVGTVVRNFAPVTHEGKVVAFHAYVRKACHVGLYGLMAALAYHAFLASFVRPPAFGSIVAFTLGLVTLIAVTDEIHQAFVPARYASVHDIALDFGGALLGLAVISATRALRCRKKASAARSDEAE